MKKLVDRFIAVDSNGNEYTIDLYQEYIVSRSLDGEERLPGMQRYRCGMYTVSPLGNNRFHILDIDTEVDKVA